MTPEDQITTVTYERLYNLGNYENERLSAACAVVNGDVAGAWATALDCVETQHRALVTLRDRKETLERSVAELEWQERQLRERIAKLERTAPQPADEPLF